MFLLSYHHLLNRAYSPRVLCLCARGFHANAPRLSLPIPPALFSLETKADGAGAREWLSAFRSATVPRNLVELSFSRSSGPGGQVRVHLPPRSTVISSHVLTFDVPQNVNKVNTKATIRCQIDAKWIPSWAHGELRKSVSSFCSPNLRPP